MFAGWWTWQRGRRWICDRWADVVLRIWATPATRSTWTPTSRGGRRRSSRSSSARIRATTPSTRPTIATWRVMDAWSTPSTPPVSSRSSITQETSPCAILPDFISLHSAPRFQQSIWHYSRNDPFHRRWNLFHQTKQQQQQQKKTFLRVLFFFWHFLRILQRDYFNLF